MRKLLPLLAVCLSTAFSSFSQCALKYSQTKLDWDKKSFISTVGYATGYLSTTMCTNQNFAFGAIQLNIVHNYPVTATTSPHDNSKHTGDVGSYGWGEDVEFIGDGKITLSFSSPVYNLKFSLLDLEKGQRAAVTAFNGAVALPVTMTASAGASSILTIANSNTLNPTATALNGNGQTGKADNDKNVGSVNIDIAGPITQVVVDVTLSDSKGTENDFFLTDITACALGSFPSDYQKTGNNPLFTSNQPFTGQPDYFLTTPDNNSVYMVDPATGKAWHVFTEPNTRFINSFAYDPYNKILYYVLDGSTNASGNKKIRKYDFNTETASDFITDVTSYGIPTFDQGVESAAASFYDGALYIGIEGGSQKESMVWRININNGVPAQAYQVFATPTTGHDWGDFILKNGTLFDFNTSQNGTSQFKHHTLMNDSLINYPVANVGQAGMSWTGDLYSVRNIVEKYNEDGTKGAAQAITVVKGPAWVGNAGDASEPFKPKADFGDAPASYDPVALSPAVHEMDTALRIGATVDREWVKTSSINADADVNDEDGLVSGRIMNLNNGNYLAQVNVYNNTGSDATVVAWADFNADGVFQPEEGAVAATPVTSSTVTKTIDLYWNNITANLAANSYTYLRVRVTSAVNGMTVNSSTGYFPNGEVEDHFVVVNTVPLAVRGLKFEADKMQKGVQLEWTVAGDDLEVIDYRVQRSKDASNWKQLSAFGPTGSAVYTTSDMQPLQGDSYYRLEVALRNGQNVYSEVKKVSFGVEGFRLSVLSNPAVNRAQFAVYAQEEGKARVMLLDNNGNRVVAQSITINKGYTEVTIPVSQLSSGLYFLYVQTKDQLEQKKIMVVNN